MRSIRPGFQTSLNFRLVGLDYELRFFAQNDRTLMAAYVACCHYCVGSDFRACNRRTLAERTEPTPRACEREGNSNCIPWNDRRGDILSLSRLHRGQEPVW